MLVTFKMLISSAERRHNQPLPNFALLSVLVLELSLSKKRLTLLWNIVKLYLCCKTPWECVMLCIW